MRRDLVFVDAKDDGEVRLVLGRCAEDDLLGPGGEMVGIAALLGFALSEDAGGFDRDLDAHVAPGQPGRAAFSQDLYALAVDLDLIVRDDLYFAVKGPVHGIVLEQQRQLLGVAKVVDRGDLELIGALSERAEHQPANASESVNAYSNCHCRYSQENVVLVAIVTTFRGRSNTIR